MLWMKGARLYSDTGRLVFLIAHVGAIVRAMVSAVVLQLYCILCDSTPALYYVIGLTIRYYHSPWY